MKIKIKQSFHRFVGTGVFNDVSTPDGVVKVEKEAKVSYPVGKTYDVPSEEVPYEETALSFIEKGLDEEV